MRAARMHAYSQPLVLEDVPVPEIEPNEVLVKVGGAGMCRTDVQLLDGYFRPYAESTFPLTLGHEIAGEIDKIGGMVPNSAGFEEGIRSSWSADGETKPAAIVMRATRRSAPTGSGLGLAPTADTLNTFPFPCSI